MAVDGWVITPPPEPLKKQKHAQPNSGLVSMNDVNFNNVLDDAAHAVPKEPKLADEPETREIGHGMFGLQNEKVQKEIENLSSGELWKDSEFPPKRTSLYYSSDKDSSQIVWKRPQEISDDPQLLISGMTRDDIHQGNLGDCWFLSAVAAVSQRESFLNKVIPDRLALSAATNPDYKGYCKFRFWRFGEWVEVYVDDYLPTIENQLCYVRSSNSNEFWISLLEKAYAKLHTCYESIEGGQAMDALVDLTGGIAERYELAAPSQDLYQKLAKASDCGAFITCTKKGDWKSIADENSVDDSGLMAGHAYTVTAVKRIKRTQGAECLLRIRNPWGCGHEWNGAWSDGDDRWNLVDQQTKDWLQFIQKEDGEFWMCFKDFCKHFQEVTICTLGPDFDGDGSADQYGTFLSMHSSWVEYLTAGGSRNEGYASYEKNPQFLLEINESDDRDPSLLHTEEAKNTCSVVIGLMQEHRRSQRHLGVKMLQIGYHIYKARDHDSSKRLDEEYFRYNNEIAKSGSFTNYREMCCRFELLPGKYIIIPASYKKDEAGTFLLRLYAAKKIKCSELHLYAEDHAPKLEELMPPQIYEARPGTNVYDAVQGQDIDDDMEAVAKRDSSSITPPSR